ncbi:3'(2'),5'-bisphosphate nucleotidase CysQ [Blastococcus haudaquaticus]|uniref:3'(2'),5-bisphosphonucleoside 3'(2')-phosphohydrolase n=1 Tax=Blastococcus haudaquaticus TaxID=1938745 RepID=A0A286GZ88_9ACTN|nr:3'(2'),5'-bisphosphate nucleotidase CysQ [Blastococcus haudaquaticus]SOE00384.1 3'(2'),5'-bisphosphate nucleotidase [Blastococcus haudaquaticus]
MPPRNDHELARDFAESAGALLVQVRGRTFADASARKGAGDAESHRFLSERLGELCPDDAVLSEEGADDAARLDADRVWIVDPLDGTREFSEPYRTDWAVHVALWERGELAAGAVAIPAEGLTLHTGEAPALPAAVDAPVRLAVSRSRPPALVQDLAAQLGGELVPMGSAGVKAMAVVRGQADAYVHGGGQYEWDSAAPVAVARAAGLHTSRLDGTPLRYNQPDPWLPDLLICRPELADRLLAAIAEMPREAAPSRPSHGGAH